MRTSPRKQRVVAILGACALTAGLCAPAVLAAGPKHYSAIPNGGTVIAAESDTPDTLNPLLSQQLSTADIDSAIFDSLVKIGSKGQFMPDLATRWTSKKRGTIWRFFLNQKATWQDGQKVTAKDVVFTTKLVNNPAFPATSTLGFDHVKTITAPNNYEVDITLTKPYAPFLAYYGTTAILPEHILGKVAPDKIRTDAAYNRSPLGSGPFKITQYAAGDHVTLSANKNYFLGAPHLAQIIFRIVPNSSTVVSQLHTGEVTLAGQTADLDASQFNSLKGVSGLTLYRTPGFDWQHVDLIENGFLKDVKVRQALQMATNRQRIIQDVALGYGTPQYSDQSPAKFYFNKAVVGMWSYNPQRAQQMLLADGFKKGSGGTLTKNGQPFNLTLYVDAAFAAQVRIVQILKEEWGQVGVNVTAKPLDPATLFGRTGPLYDVNRFKGNQMAAVEYEWIEGYDPDDTFFWACNQIISAKIKAGGNFDGYCNPQVDSLIQKGLVTVKPAKRKAVYDKIQLILAQQVPDIWLYWADVLTVATSKLHNYDPNPFDYVTAWNAKDWYLSS